MTALVRLIPEEVPYSEGHYHSIRALWARVIVRAICDYVLLKEARDLKGKRDFRAVNRWIFDENTGLKGICDLLGWQIEEVRSRALSMTRDEVRKIEHRDRDKPALMLESSVDHGVGK